MRYPLVVGSRWDIQYGNVHPQCGKTRSTQGFKVVGWQAVEVPAGKFHVLLIGLVSFSH